MAAGTTEIDLRPIEVGTTAVFKWRGKPVFVRHRTPEEIERARYVTHRISAQGFRDDVWQCLNRIMITTSSSGKEFDLLLTDSCLVYFALSADDLVVGTMKDPQTDAERCPRPEWLINIGVCTHLGCIPIEGGSYYGWFCPCHGSHYDISGL